LRRISKLTTVLFDKVLSPLDQLKDTLDDSKEGFEAVVACSV